ncbi:MAG TPA: M20/M25/M40 family metallo-hydrolase [Acidobacteriota bacterium]|nr:M20/M25/M40 family metallo-hydrolase [Acidobacteriota bacterium]HQG90055.1 M20/M25/M40 family metallo-hydrolase [Acidobacteriota bacterium]
MRCCLIAVLLIALAGLTPADDDEPGAPGRLIVAPNPISAYSICKILAGPEYAGRLTGHPGYTAAARWAADQFRLWGLEPAFPGGYLQPFPAPHTVLEAAEAVLYLPGATPEAPEREVRLEPNKDYLPLSFSDSGDHTAGMVFAGWGIAAPELGYDDYAGIDPKGKFVLCFRGTPDPADDRFTDHDQHRTRLHTARERGALGLIYIYEQPQMNTNGDWLAGFTPAEISYAVADQILAARSLTAKDLRDDLRRYRRPLSFELPGRLHLRVVSHHVPDSQGYNIAAFIPGADPALRDECVIVGAHFDGCGAHIGFIYPGANDNASGAAVVLELARTMNLWPVKPRRTVVFVLFGGEETGLQGSHAFAAGLPYGLRRAAAMVNIDMAGAGAGAWCGYSATPPAVLQAVEAADADAKIIGGKRAITRVGVRSSDFAPFFKLGIPCVSLSSDGPHLAYHEPGDTIYRINPEILGAMARLTAGIAANLADAVLSEAAPPTH